MIKIECPRCKFNIPLDKEEAVYEKTLICVCGYEFKNPNFIGESELNKYLEKKDGE